MQGRLQKGFKKASGVPVVTVSESRTRHLRAKSFIVERLGVEGGERALYLLIYLFNFMMITFLAVYLGGDF